jgi:two-component system NtrC family response regulator
VKRAVIMADSARLTAGNLDLGRLANEPPLALKAAREVADKAAIRKALAWTDNNVSNAAKVLGISRPTLYDLIKQYGLETA